MEATLVNPFIEGTLHILDTTAFVKVKPEPPFLKRDQKSQGDITGIVEVSGDLSGTAAISFSEQSILGIVSAMFGEDMTEINDEIYDAVGEISNMVAGHVTTKIAETGKKVKVKFREIKSGKDAVIEHVQGARHVLVLPFKSTKGKVVIEVSYV
ncbi:MAG: chemotaxis protein CheX [Proteobacteria bacterium]|nr:chemotaxis protein CheX [Pseudomonadota bacterium]MBU1389443.1 chemotaxis protein CheX [Pseudomonadota bacterium]MBU1541263.1 chemotaxis protein CheX [Pseudomonadota bacterium]MBU2430978.1 chemotaxis protein CheX [Pseudomonadota bacterium]